MESDPLDLGRGVLLCHHHLYKLNNFKSASFVPWGGSPKELEAYAFWGPKAGMTATVDDGPKAVECLGLGDHRFGSEMFVSSKTL